MTPPPSGSERASGQGAHLDEGGARAPSPVVGTMLRDARLRRGLTIAEAAADTRINPAYIEALESERWELMPAPVYARGFFRGYARYLGLPREAIERLVPANLPKPPDLEPVAGLRKRASEAPLSLPTLPALRLPSLAPPRRARRTKPAPGKQVERAPRAEGAPRAPRGAAMRAAGTSMVAGARSAAGGLGGATRSLDRAGRLAGWRRIEPRVAAMAAGGLAVVLVLALVATRLDVGGGEPSNVVEPNGGGQVAGPEPALGSGAASGLPAAFKEGEMPDLAGMSRKDAEATLTSLGLTFVVIEVANASAAPGTVYNHSPQAGKSIKRGDAVTLVVARAP